MRKKPTVLYTLSGTPTWEPKDCANISALSRAVDRSQDATILAMRYEDLLNSSRIMVSGCGGCIIFPSLSPLFTFLSLFLRFNSTHTCSHPLSIHRSLEKNDMTFLQVKGSTDPRRDNLFKVYSGLAPMGQSVMGLLPYKCLGPVRNHNNQSDRRNC